MERIQCMPLDRLRAISQVRERFDEERLQGLAASLKSVGQLHPLLVRHDGDEFVVLDGERRLRAARMIGWTHLSVIVEEKALGNAEIVERQYIANCQRDDLGPLEKARALAKLAELTGWKSSELATRLGISPGAVTRHMALLALPVELQQAVEAGRIPASGAYELSRLDDADEQQRLAAELLAGTLTRDGLAGRVKARSHGTRSEADRAAGRVVARLGGGRCVTVTGRVSGVDGLIELLEELLAKCRKARPTGVKLETFLRMLRDQSKLPSPS